ncbi:MAG: hypothetical protein IKL10_04665 [Clostridia bacterium]|nr:hypothetical protein [Clostridia bacterium]
MAWNNTAVTTAGNALLQRVLAGEQLYLDYAAGGSGTVDTASLMAQTTLINQQQVFNIVGLSKVANGQKVNIQILNAELKTGYIMQQIGIWAHIGAEEPLLFAILQDEKGIDIPSEYEVGDFALNFYAVIDFSNQSEFQITVDPSALVTHATLLEELSKKADKNHDHDNRYFTKSEVNELLSKKQDDLPLTDYVIEQGQYDLWTYRKWASGVAECWGEFGHWGEKVSNQKVRVLDYIRAFPFAFTAVPNVTAGVSQKSLKKDETTGVAVEGEYVEYQIIRASASKTHLEEIALLGFSQTENIVYEGMCSISVKGRWK